jgi:hypothetical protein
MKTNEIKTLALLNSYFLWIYGKGNFEINERNYPDYELAYTTPYTEGYKAKSYEINDNFEYYINKARTRAAHPEILEGGWRSIRSNRGARIHS